MEDELDLILKEYFALHPVSNWERETAINHIKGLPCKHCEWDTCLSEIDASLWRFVQSRR